SDARADRRRPGRHARAARPAREASLHGTPHGRPVRPAGPARGGPRRPGARESAVRGRLADPVPQPPAAARPALRADGDVPAGRGAPGSLTSNRCSGTVPVAQRRSQGCNWWAVITGVSSMSEARGSVRSSELRGVERMSTDRDKMLDVTLAQIEKQFGKGAVMKLGEHPMGAGISVIPTGSLALDIALGV